MSSLESILLNIGLIVASILLPAFLFLLPIIKGRLNFKKYCHNNGLLILYYALLIVGSLLRVVFVDICPAGLNQDEASIGYEAYAILTTGHDRCGNSFPIHLVSWGSGQNALYAYILIPFIAVLGLNEFSIRIPMALLGTLSLYLFGYLFKKHFSLKYAVIVLLVFALNPWHIMKSRWALESNIFPDLVFLSVFLLVQFLHKNKLSYLIFSALIMGISSYSYGTSYFFLFFFVIAIILFFVIKKNIKIWQSLTYIGIVGIVCIPIMIFIYINIKGLNSVNIGPITIPKLTSDRFHDVTDIFSANFFSDSFNHFVSGLQIIITGYDGLIWNSLPIFGTMYFISIPFIIFSFAHRHKENHYVYSIMCFWLIVSLLMMFIVDPNINRINIVFFPLIFFVGDGFYQVSCLSKKTFNFSVVCYCIFALFFCKAYYVDAQSDFSGTFNRSLGESIQYAVNLKKKKVYVDGNYVQTLFYTKANADEFVDTVYYLDPSGAFRTVVSYTDSDGTFIFSMPNVIDKDSAVIVWKYSSYVDTYKNYGYHLVEFERYYVVTYNS
jgi:hypothetical protein